MTARQVTTKADLLDTIEHNWTALNAALEPLSQTQMTTLSDVQGWTVKDHLVHLTAWERSAVFFLQGRPRHAGLGVDEETYLSGDKDIINAAVYQQSKDVSLTEAWKNLRHIHQVLLTLLEPLTDEDLNRHYRHYLPDEPGDGDGPPAMKVIYGNSAHHFAEHLDWIETLVGDDA